MQEDVAARVAEWAGEHQVEPLGGDLVPGADEAERRSLAALGGLARALLGRHTGSLPPAVKAWLDVGVSAPPGLIEDVRCALDEDGDVLAAIYERVVAGTNRRRLGTFFTPPSVVEFMLDRVAETCQSVERVIDPGAGVGAFTVASARRWPHAQILGVDVNVVTLGLLAVRLVHDRTKTKVKIVHSDYLTWITDSANWDHAGPTALLGNPPYTRHQELDAKLKELGRASAGDLLDSGLAGLAAYFIATSLRSLRPSDCLCFVLPGSWIEARYGRPLRDWLWRASNRQVDLFAFPSSVEVFTGTQVIVTVLVVGPETSRSAVFRTGLAHSSSGGLIVSRPVLHRRGEAMPDLGHALWPAKALATKGTVPLGEIGRVRRGVATGANAFFFITDRGSEDLPSSVLTPALRRLRHVVGSVLDKRAHDEIGRAGVPRWLLNLTDPRNAVGGEVQRLISEGVRAGYDARYLTGLREHWYVTEMIDPPHIVVGFMGKTRLRAVWNKVGAVPSNSMYGVYLNNPAQAPDLVAWLNSDAGQQALRREARHYSGGLLKLESRACARVRVPGRFKD